MKIKQSLLAALILLPLLKDINAQSLTWDGANTVTTGAQGGTGTWNTTTSNWWNGSNNVLWPTSGTNNDAVFAGTAGTVTIATGGVTVNDMTFNTTGYALSGAAITLNGTTPTISTGTNITATISSTISGSSGLTKDGAGILRLGGANNFTGGTTLTNGTIVVGNSGALSSGTLLLNGGILTSANISSGNEPTITNAITANGGNISGGANTLFRVNGNISGSAALGLSAVFNSSGLRLAGDNSGYNGTVTVTGSNVRLGSTTASSTSQKWVVNGNLQLDVAGTNTFHIGELSGSSSGGISGHATNAASAVSTLSVGALNTNSVFSGIIANMANNTSQLGNVDAASNNVLALTKTGSGTLTLSGNNTYTGATTIAGGTLSASNIVVASGASNLGNATSAVTLGAASTQGVLSYTGNSATFTRGFTIGGAGGGRLDVTTAGQTLQVNSGAVTGSGLFTVGGAGNTTINANLTHTGGLTKTGSGQLSLNSNLNNYSGATNVNEGTLVVNGNISTSNVTVASGATIGGSGTVGALTVQAGGFVNPGNSPGILNTGNYSQAGTLVAEIAGLSAGTQHDQINVTGTVSLSGSLNAQFSAGSYQLNDMIFLILNDSTDAVTGTFN
ncbi:MAG: hypothetical protein EAZ81_02730, partial [Verrucomicrobia bacterium]